MLKIFGRDLVNVECNSDVSFLRKELRVFNTSIFDQIRFPMFMIQTFKSCQCSNFLQIIADFDYLIHIIPVILIVNIIEKL